MTDRLSEGGIMKRRTKLLYLFFVIALLGGFCGGRVAYLRERSLHTIQTLPDGRTLYPSPGKVANYPVAVIRGFGWGFTIMWLIYAGFWTTQQVRRLQRLAKGGSQQDQDSVRLDEKEQ